VQRWLFFQAAHVTPACIPVFRATNARVQEFWKTKAIPRLPRPAARARALPPRDRCRPGGGRLASGEFSLADIAYVPHLTLIDEGGFDFAPYPRVRDWLTRLQSRPAWRRWRR